jgi:hypothetical protein
MGKKRILVNWFKTWTEILCYLDNVASEYRIYHIRYKADVYYNEILNSYKVKIEV